MANHKLDIKDSYVVDTLSDTMFKESEGVPQSKIIEDLITDGFSPEDASELYHIAKRLNGS